MKLMDRIYRLLCSNYSHSIMCMDQEMHMGQRSVSGGQEAQQTIGRSALDGKVQAGWERSVLDGKSKH